jgi:putative N6-adenine-specific DNA methylase
MNAVRVLLAALAPAELRALARARTSRFDPPVPDEDDHADPLAWACARWGGDLATALNLCHKDHLQVMARAVGVDHRAELPALRLALWRWGAALEAGGTTYLGTPLQPAPVVLAGHLVVHGPPHGLYPPAPRWPRPLPGPRPAEPPADEPATIDELLAAADAAVGVRLGQRGRDKGAWGQRAAAGGGPGHQHGRRHPHQQAAAGAVAGGDPGRRRRGHGAVVVLPALGRRGRALGQAVPARPAQGPGRHSRARLLPVQALFRRRRPARHPQRTHAMIVDELRVIGSPQTGKVMHAELIRVATRALGRRPPEPRKEGTGQLVYPFDPELAQVAVAYLRTATRVVHDLYRSTARRLEPLYDELVRDGAADQRPWIKHARTLSVAVRRVGEFPAGERQVIGTVKNAIVDAQRARGHHLAIEPERPDLPFVVRLDDAGDVVVSLDLGGASLSQRGWRRDHGEAPMREHLAAVLLMLARFDPRQDALVDPMCGSGTIPIEAVLAARATPRPLLPVARKLADRPVTMPLFPDARPLAIGADLDLEALIDAKANARDADASADVIWQRGDARRLGPDDVRAMATERGHPSAELPGVIVCNPPYGERLGDRDEVMDLYRDLAHNLRRFRGWRIGILSAHPYLAEAFWTRPTIKKPLANGNLRAYYYQYEP